MFLLSDKPAQPTLSVSNLDPTDGDAITLTCTAAEAAVDGYEFLLDGSSVVVQAGNTLSIAAAAIGTDDGIYTCIASIDTVSSDPSAGLNVQCE